MTQRASFRPLRKEEPRQSMLMGDGTPRRDFRRQRDELVILHAEPDYTRRCRSGTLTV